LTDVASLLIEFGIVTVEPIDATVGLEIGLFEDAPNGRAMYRLGMSFVDDVESDVIESPACAGLAGFFRVEAMQMTRVRSSGGKMPRPPSSRQVLQAGQAVDSEAFSPPGDGLAVTAELDSDLPVGRLVWLGSPQDQADPEGKRLWCGMGPFEGF
jgi:hypothetical protein